MTTETIQADTEDPATTEVAYAWASEPDDEPTEAEELIPRGGNGLVVAVATLAAVGAIAAVVAAAVALTAPKPQPDHFTIRPPVEVVPPPAPKPPPVTTTVTAAPPPVAQPPAPAPLTASERFSLMLQRDGMYSAGTPAEDDYRGRQVCQAVANGADPDRLSAGGDDVDSAHGTRAVHDALRAYCPALDR